MKLYTILDDKRLVPGLMVKDRADEIHILQGTPLSELRLHPDSGRQPLAEDGRIFEASFADDVMTLADMLEGKRRGLPFLCAMGGTDDKFADHALVVWRVPGGVNSGWEFVAHDNDEREVPNKGMPKHATILWIGTDGKQRAVLLLFAPGDYFAVKNFVPTGTLGDLLKLNEGKHLGWDGQNLVMNNGYFPLGMMAKDDSGEKEIGEVVGPAEIGSLLDPTFKIGSFHYHATRMGGRVVSSSSSVDPAPIGGAILAACKGYKGPNRGSIINNRCCLITTSHRPGKDEPIESFADTCVERARQFCVERLPLLALMDLAPEGWEHVDKQASSETGMARGIITTSQSHAVVTTLGVGIEGDDHDISNGVFLVFQGRIAYSWVPPNPTTKATLDIFEAAWRRAQDLLVK